MGLCGYRLRWNYKSFKEQIGETMIKYRTGGYKDLITEFECERQTEKSVWAKSEWNGKFERCLNETEYRRFLDTWEAAHKHLLGNAEEKVKMIAKRLKKAHDELIKIQHLEKGE